MPFLMMDCPLLYNNILFRLLDVKGGGYVYVVAIRLVLHFCHNLIGSRAVDDRRKRLMNGEGRVGLCEALCKVRILGYHLFWLSVEVVDGHVKVPAVKGSVIDPHRKVEGRGKGICVVQVQYPNVRTAHLGLLGNKGKLHEVKLPVGLCKDV